MMSYLDKIISKKDYKKRNLVDYLTEGEHERNRKFYKKDRRRNEDAIRRIRACDYKKR